MINCDLMVINGVDLIVIKWWFTGDLLVINGGLIMW
jgi:hypothetical protein